MPLPLVRNTFGAIFFFRFHRHFRMFLTSPPPPRSRSLAISSTFNWFIFYSCFYFTFKVGLGIPGTDADSQWNPDYKAFYWIRFCEKKFFEIIRFCQILIFSQPPFGQFHRPKIEGIARSRDMPEPHPVLSLFLAGKHNFPIFSKGSKAPKSCNFRGPVKFKLLTTSKEEKFLWKCTTKPCRYQKCAQITDSSALWSLIAKTSLSSKPWWWTTKPSLH